MKFGGMLRWRRCASTLEPRRVNPHKADNRMSLSKSELHSHYDTVASRSETSQNGLEDDRNESLRKEGFRRGEPRPFDQSFFSGHHSSCRNQRADLLACMQVVGSPWNYCSAGLHSLRHEGRNGASGEAANQQPLRRGLCIYYSLDRPMGQRSGARNAENYR